MSETCNCYMLNAPEQVRWAARMGQHATDCPLYRESLDPVDRMKDRDAAKYFAEKYGAAFSADSHDWAGRQRELPHPSASVEALKASIHKWESQ